MRFAARLAFAMAALAAPGTLRAESPEFETDRPDFVESALSVGHGRFQLETSVRTERGRAGETVLTSPTLLRVGLGPAFELRAESEGVVYAADPGPGGAELSDVAVGFKWHVLDGESVRPSACVIVHLDLPSGSGAAAGEGLRPSARAVADWDLTRWLSMAVMPGLVWDTDDAGARYLAPLFGVTFGQSLTEAIGTFVELSVHQLAAARHGGHQLTLDAGLGWRPWPDLQLDLSVNAGLTEETPPLAAALGLSVRF